MRAEAKLRDDLGDKKTREKRLVRGRWEAYRGRTWPASRGWRGEDIRSFRAATLRRGPRSSGCSLLRHASITRDRHAGPGLPPNAEFSVETRLSRFASTTCTQSSLINPVLCCAVICGGLLSAGLRYIDANLPENNISATQPRQRDSRPQQRALGDRGPR
jgi:hypothetical protein